MLPPVARLQCTAKGCSCCRCIRLALSSACTWPRETRTHLCTQEQQQDQGESPPLSLSSPSLTLSLPRSPHQCCASHEKEQQALTRLLRRRVADRSRSLHAFLLMLQLLASYRNTRSSGSSSPLRSTARHSVTQRGTDTARHSVLYQAGNQAGTSARLNCSHQ